MKKSLVVTLALVFVLGLAGTAFANPYSDVPAGHWAYKAVSDLQKAGIMEGANGKFQGNQTLTRYEIAAITARAMAKADKADAAQKATIDKLAVEFSKELNDLGVRVAALEKKTTPVKLGVFFRERVEATKSPVTYNGTTNVLSTNESNWSYLTRYRVWMRADIDDNWKMVARYGQDDTTSTSATATNVGSPSLQQAYITGKTGDINLSVGRMPLALGKLLIADSSAGWDGVTADFALADVKVKVGMVEKYISKTYKSANAASETDANRVFYLANAAYKVSNDLDLTAAYLSDNGKRGVDKSEIYDTLAFGATYKMGDFALTGEFGTNKGNGNSAVEADGWMGQFKYKAADASKVGTWGAWVGYRSAEKNFDPKGLTTLDFTAKMSERVIAAENIKGSEVGVEYTLFKNGVLTAKYFDLKEKDAAANSAKSEFKGGLVQLELNF